MPQEIVTLQNIADRAGVSRSLVSMALRNSTVVAQRTRDRIRRLADEMGYRPNPLIRSLMSSLRTHERPRYRATLAFVTNFETRDVWRKWTTYPDYFGGAVERGAQLGYKVEHFWLREYARRPRHLVEVLKARGIHGLLIAPLPASGTTLDLDLSEISAVTLGYTLAAPQLHRVCNHHVQTVQQALGELQALGYRRIGVALREADIRRVAMLWQAGLVVAQEQMPDLKVIRFEPADWNERSFDRWFEKHRPEVIVGVSQEVWEWTMRLGRAIPEEVGFLHLDCAPDDPRSGMHQKSRTLGASAIEVLAGMVEGNLTGPIEETRALLVGSCFNRGSTLRVLPAASARGAKSA